MVKLLSYFYCRVQCQIGRNERVIQNIMFGNMSLSGLKLATARLPAEDEVIGFYFMHHRQCDNLKYCQRPLRQKSRTLLLSSWPTLKEWLSYTTTLSRKLNVFRLTSNTGYRTTDSSGYEFLDAIKINLRAWGGVVVKALRTVQDRSPVVSLGIISVIPSDKTMCPEVDSTSENEHQGFLLG
jgi:hypothetical protein